MSSPPSSSKGKRARVFGSRGRCKLRSEIQIDVDVNNTVSAALRYPIKRAYTIA